MIRQQSKRLAKIEASLQIGLRAPALSSKDEWAAMSLDEAARCYFDFINAPMSPALAAASRASSAGISPVEAQAAYDRMIGATA